MTGIGSKIGPYEITGELGRGGMAVVWRGFDPNLEREVAVKEPLVDDSLAPEKRQEMERRFINEAKAAARLNHPNIVRIHAADVYDGRPAIVMEMVEGASLSQVIAAGGTLSADAALDIVDQLLDGIGYAHSQGIVHRDLKPDNVFLAPDGTVKIGDFGIAHLEGASSTYATQMGSVLGTPGYMSPEQARGAEVDGRSDLFSVGVIAYEMLSGKTPFLAEEGNGASNDALSLIYRITHEDPAPLPPEAVSAAPAFAEGIMCALRKNPGNRPSTAEGLKAVMHGLVPAPEPRLPEDSAAEASAAAPKRPAGQGAAGGSEDGAAVAGKRGRRALVPIAAALAVLLLALGIGFFAAGGAGGGGVTDGASAEGKALSAEELYRDKCSEYLDEYGEPDIISYRDLDSGRTGKALNGLAFAKLIDFNNDGDLTLMLAYPDDSLQDGYEGLPDYTIEFWHAKDGEIEKAYTDSTRQPFNFSYIESFITKEGGIQFLAEGYTDENILYSMEFIGRQGDAIGKLFSFKYSKDPRYLSINDELCSYSYADDAWKNYLSDSFIDSSDKTERSHIYAFATAGEVTATEFFIQLNNGGYPSDFVQYPADILRTTEETLTELGVNGYGSSTPSSSSSSAGQQPSASEPSPATEEELRAVFASAYPSETVYHFYFADFDADGTNEAFAITGDSLRNDINFNPNDSIVNPRLYFVTVDGAKQLNEEVGDSISDNRGVFSTNGYSFVETNGHGVSAGHGMIFGVRNGVPQRMEFKVDSALSSVGNNGIYSVEENPDGVTAIHDYYAGPPNYGHHWDKVHFELDPTSFIFIETSREDAY